MSLLDEITQKGSIFGRRLAPGSQKQRRFAQTRTIVGFTGADYRARYPEFASYITTRDIEEGVNRDFKRKLSRPKVLLAEKWRVRGRI